MPLQDLSLVCVSHKNHCARLFCSFTDNTGLCGIPGLPTCGSHLSAGAKIGIGLASLVTLLLIATCLTCWWKRRQNILRAQKMAGKLSSAPYVAYVFLKNV